jgi:hypothetical protein
MTSSFDPSVFLDAITTEALVKRPPLPAGQEFVGSITKLVTRPWQKKDDPTSNGIAIDVTIDINLDEYPGEKAKLGGIAKVILVDGIMLNLTEAGTIDWSPGKNAKLRSYRESLGMNEAGRPFSIRAMEGHRIKVRIKHDPYEGEIYDKVDRVVKA